MTDEATTADVGYGRRRRDTAAQVARRVGHGTRRSHNWVQLVRFAAVGAMGYVVNIATFALLVHVAGLDYRVAATAAFLVAVTNNFAWNRRWTFRHARSNHARSQAVRFLVVSVVAFGFNLLLLELLVSAAGLPEVPAQAIAVACATPLNFVGNKLWSFRA